MDIEKEFESIFYDFLIKLKVISKVRLSHCMSAGIYGTTDGKYEENYIISDVAEIEGLHGFAFIDKVWADKYGFIESGNEVESYEFLENNDLRQGYHGHIEISKINVQPFSKLVHLQYSLNKDAHEIFLLAQDNLFYMELVIYGCVKELEFWRKILYQSYILYKVGDIIGAFINMFIAFESMLRAKTSLGEEALLNTVYCRYTGETNDLLPKDLHGYRLIRNELLHGEYDVARHLFEGDLLLLLRNIDSLYFSKKPYEQKGKSKGSKKVKKTWAVREALKKEHKRLNKR